MSKSKKDKQPVIDDKPVISNVIDSVKPTKNNKTTKTKSGNISDKKTEITEKLVDTDTKQFTRNTKLKKITSGKLSDIKQTECMKDEITDKEIKVKDIIDETETKLVDNVFTHENGNTYYNNTDYKLSLKQSKIKDAGLGVFAEEFIPKGKLIGNYDGKMIQRKKKHFDPDYSMEINEKYVVDGSYYPRPLTSMINDTYKTKKKYNCEFIVRESKKRVEVHSIRPIAEGDELYIDYGNEYWTSRSS
jgi:hypothetical protein